METVKLLTDMRSRANRWLRVPTSVDRAEIEAMRSQLDLLEYLVTPKLGFQQKPGPVIGNPVCAEQGCKAGWKQGLINYANAGFDPVWYCEAHKKTMEHTHHPPGSPEPQGPLLQRAEEMTHRWAQFLELMKRPPDDAFGDRSS